MRASYPPRLWAVLFGTCLFVLSHVVTTWRGEDAAFFFLSFRAGVDGAGIDRSLLPGHLRQQWRGRGEHTTPALHPLSYSIRHPPCSRRTERTTCPRVLVSSQVRKVQAVYESCVFPRLHAHQAAMVVPLVAGNMGRPLGEGNCNAGGAYLQNNTVVGLEGLFEWAKAEPRVAGFCPWHYNDRCMAARHRHRNITVMLLPRTPYSSTTAARRRHPLRRVETRVRREASFSRHRAAQATPRVNCSDGKPPCDMDVGAVSLPKVLAKLREIGAQVGSASARRP